MRIGHTEIGNGRVYVIAEAGVNHNGDLDLAKKLVSAAKNAGADAVKFQTFTTDEIVTENASQAEYQSENTGVIESQASMLRKLELSRDEFVSLKRYADESGIEFISTPFSAMDADFLESVGVAAFKVSSGDLTNLPFLQYISKKNKPVIISTGMATLEEVEEAYAALKKTDSRDIAILQCTSEYPTPLSHANLRVIEMFQKKFNTPIGYSDHTEGINASIYATALGACIIEKHFTLDRNMPGPDHRASLEPTELKEMIEKIRNTAPGSIAIPDHVLGSMEKVPTSDEKITAKLVRKGIAARTSIKAGETLSENNIFIARPEGLILPKEWDKVLGKRVREDVAKGASLSWDMIV